MPASARRSVPVDRCVPLSELAATLVRLVNEPMPADMPTPPQRDRLEREMSVFRGEGSAMETLNEFGKPSMFACPDCDGVLWEVGDANPPRYRCPHRPCLLAALARGHAVQRHRGSAVGCDSCARATRRAAAQAGRTWPLDRRRKRRATQRGRGRRSGAAGAAPARDGRGTLRRRAERSDSVRRFQTRPIRRVAASPASAAGCRPAPRRRPSASCWPAAREGCCPRSRQRAAR